MKKSILFKPVSLLKYSLVVIVLSVISAAAFADGPSKLTCTTTDKENFIGDKVISVIVDDRSITIASPNITELSRLPSMSGSFVKLTKQGDGQFDIPDLNEMADQTDHGMAFLSPDGKRLTFSLLFTDDDGPQSFIYANFTCALSK